MALIYITGASGAGKSTVRTELQRRGYPAYDSDEDRLARWFSTATVDEVRRELYQATGLV
jgi:dephospho-CoA kinase